MFVADKVPSVSNKVFAYDPNKLPVDPTHGPILYAHNQHAPPLTRPTNGLNPQNP